MSRVAWFHPFAGIAGDMALGSLVDAGADGDEIVAALRGLPFTGWSLRFEQVLRSGVRATRAVVEVTDTTTERSARDVRALVERADLPARVTTRALRVFDALAAAEGTVHGRPPAEVHFHEVGGHDAIIDVVGTAIALELLGVDEVRSAPVALGHGTVRGAHGVLPSPPPAVAALLEGIPVLGVDLAEELTTPTGAALLRALCDGFGPIPELVLEATGYGAGTRERDGLPNCVQVLIGTAAGAAPGQPLALVEANLDDATGEILADTVAALLGAGAQDAWITPVVMKKGRPGHVVSALCEPGAVGTVRGVLLRESGSFGARVHLVDRYATARWSEEVDVDGHTVRVKANGEHRKVEHDDAAGAARALGLPVREVIDRATAAYDERRGR